MKLLNDSWYDLLFVLVDRRFGLLGPLKLTGNNIYMVMINLIVCLPFLNNRPFCVETMSDINSPISYLLKLPVKPSLNLWDSKLHIRVSPRKIFENVKNTTRSIERLLIEKLCNYVYVYK